MSDTVSSKSLFDRLKGRGEMTAFAEKLGYKDVQRISNWRKRGIPKSALIDVVAALGMTVEQYCTLAGEKRTKIDNDQKDETQKNIPRNDAEKLLALIQTFLDTDTEGRTEALAAVQAVVGDNGIRHRADNGRKRKRR